jgi:hypothetical protein
VRYGPPGHDMYGIRCKDGILADVWPRVANIESDRWMQVGVWRRL